MFILYSKRKNCVTLLLDTEYVSFVSESINTEKQGSKFSQPSENVSLQSPLPEYVGHLDSGLRHSPVGFFLFFIFNPQYEY